MSDSQCNNIADIFLPTGNRLNQGRYEIIRVLGHGGFGITYLALDIHLRQNVAIKEYFPHGFVQRQPSSSFVQPYSGERYDFFKYGLDRYLEEAQTLARFYEYPGIVNVFNFFEENGTAYLVMEYLEGQTVKEWLRSRGERVCWDEAILVMRPVMNALQLLHEEGLIHRDISPDNIFLCNNNQVKLLDFGAARYAMGEHSQSLSVILKHGYAPFEQYTSRGKQGPWTDVYALGATVYRAVTGVVPPNALDRVNGEPLLSLSECGISIAEETETALLKSLAVHAADRYQVVTELFEGLSRGIENHNVEGFISPYIEVCDFQPARYSVEH